MTQPTSTTTPGPATPVEEPQDATSPAPRARTPRGRVPWWLTHTPTAVAVLLIVVILELAAFELLGLYAWVAANVVVWVVVFVAALAWRRRGKGGLLASFLAGLRRGRGWGRRGADGGPEPDGRGVGARLWSLLGRTPGGGDAAAGGAAPGRERGALSRMFGGRPGAGGEAGPGGAPAGGRGGLLGRLVPRGRSTARGSGGGAGEGAGSGSGRSGGGLRSLLRPRRAGGGGAKSGPGSGSGSSAPSGGGSSGGRSGKGGRLRSLLGRNRNRSGGSSGGRGGATGPGGGGASGGGAGRGKPRAWNLLRPRKPPSAPASGGAKPTTPETSAAPGRGGKPGLVDKLKAGLREGLEADRARERERTQRRAEHRDQSKAPEPQQKDAKPGGASRPGPERPGRPPAPPPQGRHWRDPQPMPKPRQAPRHSAGGTTEGGRTPVTIQHSDDASLQRWGRNIGSIGQALAEVADVDSKAHEAGKTVTAGIRKLAVQGENDQPASKRLVAELDHIARSSQRIDDEIEALIAQRRALAAQAEALPARYRTDHETDEARLQGERGGRQREKRADVTAAEQDV